MSTFMQSLVEARELPACPSPRYPTGINVLDQIFTTQGMSGLETGVYLLGGDPGCGKSTFALQVMRRLVSKGHTAVYCAYEGIANIHGCMRRMLLPPVISIVDQGDWEPDTETLCNSMRTFQRESGSSLPLVLCIDSIKNLDGGSIKDRKAAIKALHTTAHETGTILFIIGHATKESQGKKVKKLEGPSELVGQSDAMMYFVDVTPPEQRNDGSREINLDMTTKNRFGRTGEFQGFRLGEYGFSWPLRIR